MTLCISDRPEEFRIEISGRFADSAVTDAATAWRAALLTNTPRRICVDITRMTGYDRAGFELLREFNLHGTHIAAGTPRALLFLTEISRPKAAGQPVAGFEGGSKRSAKVVNMPPRAAASGE